MAVLSVSRKWKVSSEGGGGGGGSWKEKITALSFRIFDIFQLSGDDTLIVDLSLNSFEVKVEKLSLPRRLKEKYPGRSGARGEKRRGAKVFKGCRNLVYETWNWTPASLFPSALKGQDFYTVLSESDTKIRLTWIKLVPEALNLLPD